MPLGMARLMTQEQYHQLLGLIPTIHSTLDTNVHLFWQTLALMARSANQSGSTFYLSTTNGRAIFTAEPQNGPCVEMRTGRWYVHTSDGL